MKNLIGICLVSLLLMNTVVFAEANENNNSEIQNTDSFDNLSQVKRNAVSTKSFLLDTVLSRKVGNRQRAKASETPQKEVPQNTKPRINKPAFTGRVKPINEVMDEKNENTGRKPKGKTGLANNNKPTCKRVKSTVNFIKGNINDNAFSVRNGEVISQKMVAAIVTLAREYQRLSGEKLIITSAARTPFKQASAMIGLIDRHGAKHVYRLYKDKKAVGDVLYAYRENRDYRPKAVKEMTKVIEKQVANGIYISRHLRQNAIDVSRISEPKSLKKAVAKVGGNYFFEKDHYHINLPQKG
ncbi:MAG TPA: hypothetical protein PKE69_14285 [Pyrinomonadaceae bacterium]|nr:hypothetical protein [Pyrinomonadaceae bacterium]